MVALVTIRGFPASLPEAEIRSLLETIGQVRSWVLRGFHKLCRCDELPPTALPDLDRWKVMFEPSCRWCCACAASVNAGCICEPNYAAVQQIRR